MKLCSCLSKWAAFVNASDEAERSREHRKHTSDKRDTGSEIPQDVAAACENLCVGATTPWRGARARAWLADITSRWGAASHRKVALLFEDAL